MSNNPSHFFVSVSIPPSYLYSYLFYYYTLQVNQATPFFIRYCHEWVSGDNKQRGGSKRNKGGDLEEIEQSKIAMANGEDGLTINN